MSKMFSGKAVIKVLIKKFGFHVVSQKGSHIKLRKKEGKTTITTIVPVHRELALGALKGILEQAQIEEKIFRKESK